MGRKITMNIINMIKSLFQPYAIEQQKLIETTSKLYLNDLYSGKMLKINPSLDNNIESIYIKDGKLRAEIRLTSSQFLSLINGQASYESMDESVLLDCLMPDSKVNLRKATM